MLALPPPFNHTLKLGSILVFQVGSGVDFVALWNECCASCVTWQHNRPKKMTDLLQKLGLPARLSEYLREQVMVHGLEVPLGSDDSDQDAAASEGHDEPGGGNSSTSFSNSNSESEGSKDDSEDYYSTTMEEDGQEDLEEEEEAEDEPEPDELLEDE